MKPNEHWSLEGQLNQVEDKSLVSRVRHISNSVLDHLPLTFKSLSCNRFYHHRATILCQNRPYAQVEARTDDGDIVIFKIVKGESTVKGKVITGQHKVDFDSLSSLVAFVERITEFGVPDLPTFDPSTTYEAGAQVATGEPGEVVIAKRDIPVGEKFNPRDKMKWHHPDDVFQVWSGGHIEESCEIVCKMGRYKEAVEQYVQEKIRDTSMWPSAEVIYIGEPKWDGNDFRVVFHYLEGEYEGEGEVSRTLYFNYVESFI